MARGNRKEPIFWDNRDRVSFLVTLDEACRRTGWILHSYVLMPNHYHWLLETPEANLSHGMQWFQTTYSVRFCSRHELVGHVFQGRFKALPVQTGDGDYFRTASEYIHLNPARAGLLDPSAPVLADYRWSSFPLFCEPPSQRPAWLEFGRLAANYGLEGDMPESRARFREHVERRAREIALSEVTSSEQEAWNTMRRSWYFGDKEYRDDLLEKLAPVLRGKKAASFSGPMLQSHDEMRARALIQSALNRLNLGLDQVRSLRKNDPRKEAIAWLLRTHTSMGCAWIDQELDMGSRVTIYQAVRRFARGPEGSQRHDLFHALKDLIH